MMDNGIGMDMVSLSGPPIHTAPLFISKRVVKETVSLAPSNGKPPYQQQQQENRRQEAATAAALQAKQLSQQPQLQQYGGAVSTAAATATAAVAGSRRRPSVNSEEVLIQEIPKYEVRAFGFCVYQGYSRLYIHRRCDAVRTENERRWAIVIFFFNPRYIYSYIYVCIYIFRTACRSPFFILFVL